MKKGVIVLLVITLGLAGTFLWAQKWQLVATLAVDVAGGETLLMVEWLAAGTVDRLLLIESRDGTLTETNEIKHIYGEHIILKQRLKGDFSAGARIYQ